MSVPGAAFGPLPFGWTQHQSPTGQLYYHNVNTKESTYTRPLPPPPAQEKKKKEKPLVKTPIPGTDWIRVQTTEGNTFYSHKIDKKSVWVVPDEIRAAVQAMDDAHGEDDGVAHEIDRVKSEVAAAVKRKAEDPTVTGKPAVSKKAKVEEVGEDDEEDSEDGDEVEEDWEKEAAAQLEAEAEEEMQRQRDETERVKAEAAAEAERLRKESIRLNLPDRVDLSTLLREKDINPLQPWDAALPLFVSDPRYVLLSSVSARREAFDDYCRERARELRQANVKKEVETLTPKEEFERFLKDEVKSTRTNWSEFRRTWKKDRRFYGWGRDDREREKKFKEWIKELGEKKRAAALKAESDFFALLRENLIGKPSMPWKDAKRGLAKDPRYDAVGSSSLREELYDTFMKGNALSSASGSKAIEKEEDKPEEETYEEQQRKRKERASQALKDRESKVKADMERVDAQIGRSRQISDKEEGELLFKSLLTDAVRDPQMTWDVVVPLLSADPRFQLSPLSTGTQRGLFNAHVNHLRSRHMASLHALFEQQAPSLVTEFDALPLSELLDAPPVTRLGFDVRALEDEFSRWRRQRTSDCRKAFDEMLAENAFIEFWGKLRKIGGEGVDGGVKADEEGMNEDEGAGGGGKVDMKVLAKSVDVAEIEKVLKNDKRYVMFDHVPEQREQWIRSDVARLRKIVINSLYSHKEIFLRELISNANDAVEKLRLTSLKDKSLWDGSELNITIVAVKDEDGKGGRLIISDTGIGMTPAELSTNLGTLAKSGTSDFLAQADSSDATGTGNLIGAFGLGFYSSFLVADRVQVASISPKSEKNPTPAQHVFTSSADDSSYEIFADPRGATLGSHGTEITLFLKPDAVEYLDTDKLTALVNKHSSYSSTFPIYLFTQTEDEVPVEDEVKEPVVVDDEAAAQKPLDDDEAVVEDAFEEDKATPAPPKTKKVIVDEWVKLNALPPLWMRPPSEAADEDYELFYTAFWKDFNKPLGWSHFSGDSESGTSFKSIIYLPSKLGEEYWKQPLAYKSNDIKLMVKRVFITSDLGDNVLPSWAAWLKAVVDGKFKKVIEVYGNVFKLGAVEDAKNADKLLGLVRFSTNQRNFTSLGQYVENKKQGQKQIFYLAEMGKTIDDLAQSVFVEKLHARGYEVLLLNEPLDEILVQNLRQYKNLPFQDVAKAGLKFGDEDVEAEEKAEREEMTVKFEPLIKYLKEHSSDTVRDGKSYCFFPCAVVAESYGYTANVERMMASSNQKPQNAAMHEFARKAKVLEINGKSPLIEGMLKRVQQLPEDEEERDLEAEKELEEVTSILIDGALVRSGFEVTNSNTFFTRVDRVLRRSLGVSETAPTDTKVKPAPPVDPELPTEEEMAAAAAAAAEPIHVDVPPSPPQPQWEVEEVDEFGEPVVRAHDEL
ncbi:unnamed protein product [Mycena citricolor]|uniref:HSP90-domain-containing protein n=1 Tax=Mycena citricolor TaxID=2018698 RepID=A0AAD2Q4L2_9AGAR|nr:unnamed protein product [Mycena citricolor]